VSLLRGLLFDNLGLKLVALLLAVMVYLNVYTDRPATMIVAFPLQFTDLSDSLALAGPVPAQIRAEVRGTGKQLIRLRLTEPSVKVSLAGVGVGHFERVIDMSDLPLPSGSRLQLERMVTPRTIELDVDRLVHKRVPVAVRVVGAPAPGSAWDGSASVEPATVLVSGPAREMATIDSVRLTAISISGRRDTLQATVGPSRLEPGCISEPATVQVTLAIDVEATRRTVVDVESPRGAEDLTVSPASVAVIVTGPRSRMSALDLEAQRVHWTTPGPVTNAVGHRVALHRVGVLPPGVHARVEPDSVIVR
jgi:YbbR-like protein